VLRPPFKTGDKVRLKTGSSPIQVLEVDYFDCASPKTTPRWTKRSWSTNRRPMKGWYIRFQYFSSLHYGEDQSRSWREADDFVFFDPQEEDIIVTAPQLYQTMEEKPRFGTFLTKNSHGKIVLEMKGKDGEVEAFDPKDLEEVLPYTVALTRFNGGQNDGETRHYQFKQGLLKEDDVLVHLSTGALYRVTAVNTKQKTSRESKNGFFKLEGQYITTEN